MGLPRMEVGRVARQRMRLVGLQALDVPWGDGGEGGGEEREREREEEVTGVLEALLRRYLIARRDRGCAMTGR